MEDLISVGIELALFGMGTVFSFLTLLVVATKIMSSLVAKFAVEAHAMIDAGGVQSPRALSNDVLAAVTASVHQYRKDKDRQ